MLGNIRVSAILLCPQSAQGQPQLSEVTRPSYLHGGHRRVHAVHYNLQYIVALMGKLKYTRDNGQEAKNERYYQVFLSDEHSAA